MFSRIPEIQVRSEETRFLRRWDQILLEEFALAHPARCKERLGRDESNLKGPEVLFRQLRTCKVPRIWFALGHGWPRIAPYIPAGTWRTSQYQPDQNPEPPAGGLSRSPTYRSWAVAGGGPIPGIDPKPSILNVSYPQVD
jgi:hypothetical protein